MAAQRHHMRSNLRGIVATPRGYPVAVIWQKDLLDKRVIRILKKVITALRKVGAPDGVVRLANAKGKSNQPTEKSRAIAKRHLMSAQEAMRDVIEGQLLESSGDTSDLAEIPAARNSSRTEKPSKLDLRSVHNSVVTRIADRAAYTSLKNIWERDCRRAWSDTPPVERDRFLAEVLGYAVPRRRKG